MSLSSLFGQDLARSILQGVLRSGRLGHAYLFAGTDGAGKSVFAREYAKAANCEKGASLGDSCDECSSCLRIASGNHPDVLEIRPDGRLKIEQVRSALKHVEYKPLEGRVKVAILLHAELMTAEAANCLLKSLEEPPGSSLFILTTTSPASVLPTVASRCLLVPFNACHVGDVIAYLKARHPGDEEKCRAAAFWSGGIPGRADLFFEDGFLATRQKALAIITGIRELDAVGVAGEVSRDDAPLLLSCLASLLRDVLVLGAGGREGLLGNPDLEGILGRILDVWKPAAAIRGVDEISRAYAAMAANANRRQVLDVLLVELQALVEDGYN